MRLQIFYLAMIVVTDSNTKLDVPHDNHILGVLEEEAEHRHKWAAPSRVQEGATPCESHGLTKYDEKKEKLLRDIVFTFMVSIQMVESRENLSQRDKKLFFYSNLLKC